MNKQTIKSKIVIGLFRKIFLRKVFFNLNRIIFILSLRGLGILNYETNKLSGEDFFIQKISKFLNSSDCVFFDVGANIGNYSLLIRSIAKSINIYAFEPHPKTFKKLELQGQEHNYVTINAACSDVEGKLKLYDYQGEKDGSSHASLYQNAIEQLRQADSDSWEVSVITIDQFVKENNIDKISLLKIDTEGNELKVLKGSKESIKNNIIDIIHFEFNEMNVFSRVFMKDFYEILEDYCFYRMLPDGLVHLGNYNPLTWEIFAYQNIVAIHKDILPKVKKYIEV